MSKMKLAAGTSPFAHLMAGFRGKRAEEEKPEDEAAREARRAEEDQLREDENARRAEEDQRREEEDARRAEEDGTPEEKPEGNRAEDDDEQDPEADSDDDDDACDDMDDISKSAYRRGLALGRARENARGVRIFGHASAAGRPDLAATLAFTTRNTSAEAGRLMTTAGAAPAEPRGRRQSIDQRMAGVILPNPGSGGGGNTGPKSEVDAFIEMAASAAQKAGIA